MTNEQIAGNLMKRLRGAETEKRDLQQAINHNVQTMQILADRVEKSERLRGDAEFVSSEITKAYRALEGAARDVVECLHGDEDLSRSQREVLQRLVEVLEKK